MCETLWVVLTIVLKTSLIVAVLYGVLSGGSPQKIAEAEYETLEFSACFGELESDLFDASVRSDL